MHHLLYGVSPGEVVRQDAVDAYEATDEDLAELKCWKKFRVALNRVPLRVGYAKAICSRLISC
ncbi:tail fiber assembly protein [Pseudomonas gessardii]|nr:tail fiber assembly protein [Pseudomonas gessardii]